MSHSHCTDVVRMLHERGVGIFSPFALSPTLCPAMCAVSKCPCPAGVRVVPVHHLCFLAAPSQEAAEMLLTRRESSYSSMMQTGE